MFVCRACFRARERRMVEMEARAWLQQCCRPTAHAGQYFVPPGACATGTNDAQRTQLKSNFQLQILRCSRAATGLAEWRVY